MYSKEESIKKSVSKLSTVSMAMFLLLCINGCGSDNGSSRTKSVPPEIQAVDDILSKPYSEHFKNIQGDYAVANRIAESIQIVVDKSNRISLSYVLDLVKDTGALIKDPSEENYASLKDEWNASKSKIKFKKK